MNNPRSDLFREIERVAEDFDFIDLTLEPPQNENLDLEQVKQILKKLKLPALGHTNPTVPAIYPVKSIQEAAIRDLEMTFRQFQTLGVKLVNIHPFYYSTHMSDETKISSNIRVLRHLEKYVRGLGMELMLENYLAPFHNVEVFKRIVSEVPHLKIHLDVGHMNIVGDACKITQDFFNCFGQRIVHIHAHDNRGNTDDHMPIGCGDIDWSELLDIIKSAGYDRTITLEVFCGDKDYLLLSRDKVCDWWEGL